jgi:HSP20 family molecular chaperone IbpA
MTRESPEPEKHPHSHRHSEMMYHVIDLPCAVDPSKAKATFKDGRLDIVMPKVVLAKSARG